MAESIPERIFEYHDAKSDKFWKVSVEDNTHTVTYGRVGTNGQSKTKEFKDHASAKKDAEKLIGQKTKKGYQEVLDQSESRSEQLKAEQEEAKLHEPFIDAILEDPDEVAGYLVYADWLEENGNPRGEFIRIQIQLDDETTKAADRKKLQKREKELLKAHEREWLGTLAEDLLDAKMPEEMSWYGETLYEYEFSRGFLSSIKVNLLLPAFSKRLKASPAVRMLRQIHLAHVPSGYELTEEFEEYADAEWDEDDSPSLRMLSGVPFDNLRTFAIDEEDEWNCHVTAEGVDKIIKHMPRIESINLAAHGVDSTKIFKLKMPELRSIKIYCSTNYDLVSLAKNKSLEKLESIDFFPHALEWDDEPYINLEKVQALSKAKHLEKLTHLRLSNGNFGNDGVTALSGAVFMSNLQTLDLSYGCIQDEGVDALISANTPNLKTVDLSGNFVTPDAIQRLSATGLTVVSDEMNSGEPNEDHEYLFHGDIE